jgi:hypothetical protein
MSITSEKIEGNQITVIIKSSNITAATYNTETQELTVTFNTGGIYVYNKVPWTLFTKFRMAESQGKFFNEKIAKDHKYTKIK